jgi:hypothetical protein
VEGRKIMRILFIFWLPAGTCCRNPIISFFWNMVSLANLFHKNPFF